MGWFSKKPSWAETYAGNLYQAFAADDDLGEMTPEKLRIPAAATQQYFDKALTQRECMCFVALVACAKPASTLQPVLMAFTRLLKEKRAARGLPVDIDALANTATNDVAAMFRDPFEWSQQWLAEFRNNPADNYMVVMFADHCQRQFNAYKHGIETTNPAKQGATN